MPSDEATRLKEDAAASRALLAGPMWRAARGAQAYTELAGFPPGDAGVEDAQADLPSFDEDEPIDRLIADERVALPMSPKRPKGSKASERDPMTTLGRALDAHITVLDAHTQAMATMETTMRALADSASTGATGPAVPKWLRDALGNPNTYDAPDPLRVNVHVRVVPALHARVQRVQARLGVRTAAGAWESVLRLGLAAAERLPG